MSARCIRLVIFAATLASAADVGAQIIGPGPARGKLEFGAWRSFSTYDYVVRYPPDPIDYTFRNVKFDRAAFVLRYGVSEGMYLIMNFGFIQRQYTEYNTLTGVWGGGANIRLLRSHGASLRLSGEYNDVFEFARQGEELPWRSRDARMITAVDRGIVERRIKVRGSAGVILFSSREVGYTFTTFPRRYFYRTRNLGALNPVVASTISVLNRVRVGLELTFGRVTEFRWRTEIRL